jgi:tetratricopeptide (TPR) repeat protein
MKKTTLTIAALAMLLALGAPLASAHVISNQPSAQEVSAEEAAAYKSWYDANAKAQQSKAYDDYAKAMELALDFLQKFPNSKNAAYLKDKWVPQIRTYLLGQAVAAKNLPEIVRLGKALVAASPDNVDYPNYLAGQLRSLDTNFQYSADTVEFAQTAIRLLESGKTLTAGQDGKVPDKNKSEAVLYWTMASISEHDKNADKALENYHHAATLDPTTPLYFFACGRLNLPKYTAASNDYFKFSDADRTAVDPKPEVKAALEAVNKAADIVINCWARFMGLTVGNKDWADTRSKVEGTLTDLYKYRNNNSAEGLQKLIDDNKNSPTPVSMTPPAAPTPQQKPSEDQSAMKANGGAGKPGETTKPAMPAKTVGKKPR